MAYQLYRNTTLGNTLQESLDELIQVWFVFLKISSSLIDLLQFFFQFPISVWTDHTSACLQSTAAVW